MAVAAMIAAGQRVRDQSGHGIERLPGIFRDRGATESDEGSNSGGEGADGMQGEGDAWEDKHTPTVATQRSSDDYPSPEGGSSSDGTELHVDGRPRVVAFHLALIINHIFATLHGHTFYLESPCTNISLGVDESTWNRSVSATLPRRAFSSKHRRYLRASAVCAPLPASHRLGPFPPRPAPWSKLAAIRFVARRHAFLLYLDSDAFITHVWQPIEPLISLLGLRDGRRWLAVAGEWPPQKLRGDRRAGEANSGVLLLAGAPIAGAPVLEMLDRWIWPSNGLALATFYWPFEQNALTFSVLADYPERVVRLHPGCPLNSPFGAYVRHYVGGTPDRSIYHPHHRGAWLLLALRCTVGVVAAASNHTPGAVMDATTMAALRRREGCAANELTLSLNATAG